jgi:hypothetical protein
MHFYRSGRQARSIYPFVLDKPECVTAAPLLGYLREVRSGSIPSRIALKRLIAKEAELAYNSAKGRILKKLAGIKFVETRSVLCEVESGSRKRAPTSRSRKFALSVISRSARGGTP